MRVRAEGGKAKERGREEWRRERQKKRGRDMEEGIAKKGKGEEGKDKEKRE